MFLALKNEPVHRFIIENFLADKLDQMTPRGCFEHQNNLDPNEFLPRVSEVIAGPTDPQVTPTKHPLIQS